MAVNNYLAEIGARPKPLHAGDPSYVPGFNIGLFKAQLDLHVTAFLKDRGLDAPIFNHYDKHLHQNPDAKDA
jgi:hypothetical protein